MAIDINAHPGNPHASKAQKAFDENRVSHGQAMDAAAQAESQQYQQVVRMLTLFRDLKAACDADQKTALGLLVGGKAVEQWNDAKAMTAAILQATADAMGVTRQAVLDELATQELPAAINTLRSEIASA